MKKSYQHLFKLCFLSCALTLISCQPPTVPLQSLNQGQFGRLGRFRLNSNQSLFSNGKQLLTSANGATYLSDVPFVQQGADNTCGQAVMTMALKYWGVDIDYQTVVNEGNPLNLGTSYEVIQGYIRSKDLDIQGYKDGSLEALLLQIHKGQPVIVLLDFGGLSTAHYVLVVGYNAQNNTIIMHESQSGPYVELDLGSFIEMWENDPVVQLPLFGGENYRRLMFEVKPPADA